MAGPLDNGESFELTLGSDRLVAKSGGDVNVTAGSSYLVNDAGGDIFLKVCTPSCWDDMWAVCCV